MSSSFEKSVKGATKIKAAPPKTKYIEHILVATHSGEAGVGEIFRALSNRLRDSTWTVVFKSLITIHLMIREGSPDATLAYLSHHTSLLTITTISDAQTQGRNIRVYARYLQERARAYRDTKYDWVRVKASRLEKLTVEKGLLRETEVIQRQISALLKCDIMEDDHAMEIVQTAFRLLVLDLLALFQAMNQAMINILGHFFELSKPDAERALDIYRQFAKQTDFVVSYLRVARHFEHLTRVEVPKLKHAPTNLKQQLEEYVKDPDFEINRRQYIAELQAKKSGAATGGSKSAATPSDPKPAASSKFPEPNGPSKSQPGALKPEPARGPAPDLIDFFESIEQNQTPMASNLAQQQQPQPLPQSQPQPQHQHQHQHQPFNQIPQQMANPTGFVPNGALQQQQVMGMQQATPAFSNNPYQPQQVANMQSFNPWGQAQQQPQPQPQPQQPQQLQPNFIGAGFGGFTSQPAFQPGVLGPIPQDNVANFQMSSPTGMANLQAPATTNPFRASMMISQQTAGMPPNTNSPPIGSPTNPPGPGGLQRQSTNPFARSPQPSQQQPFGSTSSPPFQSPQHTTSPPGAPLQSMVTGTNPFAKSFGGGSQAQTQQQRPATSGGPLAAQPTGSTNPFRQGAFVNHQTGMGWQNNQQPIGGGLDNLQTVTVFPRPQQQAPWQNQQQ
ncbi:ANTH-domain-containing protein [Sodiomyces alkalinus F11]|uniref:ANTH-domain-containing protein n=1 Tax=Sodiomyces alkalinus (strain CBS 110278 / VKM F-3762 / F11) TaxID=1314773 RepID=A0A3N2PZI7_SODAK|nr:ANTH-domain-containing protein [Sodiomyces alkalinus F11]ROT39917.1 ANTH-domain-containing protein [Sodiomyces alkalinus F11]